MLTELNLLHELEKDIYDAFADGCRTKKEESINKRIIIRECELKYSFNKYQKEIYEKIINLKNELNEHECIRLINYVLENYTNKKNIKKI